ncbi:glycosyltransferase family 39 protein [Candidatus Roizmanbacteria bacterium]|nr:MAG: glycosyltransferase family 39 protein [Candidatus Roizmanbacteria bacterium]
MHKRIIYFTILTLIGIGAFLRLYDLSGFITFLGDQGRDALIVKRIVTFEHFPSIGAPSSVGMVYLGPFYYYLIAPFILLSNFDPVGLAYGVSFMSIAGMIISYLIVRKLVDERTAIPFLVFSVFSYASVYLSRFSWNPNLLPIFTFLTLFFFYQWLTTKKRIMSLLSGAFLSFSIQLHYLALFLFFPLFFVYIFHFFQEKKNKKLLTGLLPAVLSFTFFSSPLILFDLRHNFLNARNFIALFTEGKVESATPFINRLLQTIQQFFSHSLQINMNEPIALITFMVIIAAFVLLFKKTKSQFLLLHGLTFISFIVLFAFLESARHLHYFGPAYPSFYLIVSAAVSLIPTKLVRYGTLALIMALFVFFNAKQYAFLRKEPNSQIDYAKGIADSFKPHITSEPIQVVTIPFTESDGHYRYFLDLAGYDLLAHDSPEQAEELFVMCFTECNPTGDPQWQIAAFADKQLAGSWSIGDVTIYKIIHNKAK